MAVQPQHETKSKTKAVTIFVNNRPVELSSRETTGAAIKKAAGVPLEFKLYGPHGEEIGNEEHLKVHPKEKFTAISGQDVS